MRKYGIAHISWMLVADVSCVVVHYVFYSYRIGLCCLRLIFICSGTYEAYGIVFKLVHISWMVGDCVSSARVHVIVLRFMWRY